MSYSAFIRFLQKHGDDYIPNDKVIVPLPTLSGDYTVWMFSVEVIEGVRKNL
jgi:hypothetical protein